MAKRERRRFGKPPESPPYLFAVAVLSFSQVTTPLSPRITQNFIAVTAQIALPVGGQLAFVGTGDVREKQENPPLSSA
jgi:hypothetical protein